MVFATCWGLIGTPPLPDQEARLAFMERYAEDRSRRLAILRGTAAVWWEEETAFFGMRRSRAWVMLRRIAYCCF